MHNDSVSCGNCGFGFDYSKIIGAIYNENYTKPYEEYWKRREEVEGIGDRLLDEQDALDDLETSYLTDGKLLLSRGKCPHGGHVGELRFN